MNDSLRLRRVWKEMMTFLFFGFDAVEYITYTKYNYVDGYRVIHITRILLALYAVIRLHNDFNL